MKRFPSLVFSFALLMTLAVTTALTSTPAHCQDRISGQPAGAEGDQVREALIRSGDRVALVGGTLIESLQTRSDLEVCVVLNRPALRVPFRNLGWSGDDVSGAARRVFGGQPDGYARLLRDLDYAAPTLAVIAYGFAEAANGIESVPEFESGLRKIAEDFKAKQIRLVFVQPFPLPGILTDNYDQAMRGCRNAIDKVATEFDGVVLDPSAGIRAAGRNAFDRAGLRLSELGQKVLGREIAAGLLGVDVDSLDPIAANSEQYEILSERISAKDELFFHRHRPMNETYLFLFRKHEQGNNAVEVDEFEKLVQQAEKAIWASTAK